jgi:LPPG:FO 2-phospho-L-lactate transferase
MSGVVVLTGGVGGAKLVHGLALAAPHLRSTAIVNTGDDFRHLGLYVSPDVDTICYTLSGKASREQGWGREGESWAFMEALRSLGGPDWFQLGDADLALHVFRTAQLASGAPLSAITADVARAWGVSMRILPATDDALATVLETDEGVLEFQRYFVERRCAPKVRAIRFEGAEKASPAPGVIEAIEQADAVVIAPSNPYLSIDPILSIADLRRGLQQTRAPVVAVSPLVAGRAVKGPTAKLMTELNVPVSVNAIAAHYAGLIDALLIDAAENEEPAGVLVGRSDILMSDDEGRARVAREALALAEQVRK